MVTTVTPGTGSGANTTPGTGSSTATGATNPYSVAGANQAMGIDPSNVVNSYNANQGAPAGQVGTATTINQNNILPAVAPYYGATAAEAFALSQNPYQAYQGQQVADFSNLQNQAFNQIGNMQTNPYTGQAAGLAGLAATNQFTGANVGQYMNPYLQSTQNAAIQSYANSLPQLGSTASKVGGLGGSREALLQSQAQQGLQQTLAANQASAFTNAEQQFNTSNANMIQGAGVMGQLGNQQFQQQAGIDTAMLGAGATQQAQEQAGLNVGYNTYLQQMQYPWTMLNNAANIYKSAPIGASTQSQYGAPPTMASQVAGLGVGLGSLFSGE